MNTIQRNQQKKSFNLFSVAVRIAAILLFMFLITLGISYIGITKIKQMNQITKEIYISNTSVLFPLSDFLTSIFRTEQFANKAVLSKDSPSISGFDGELNNTLGQPGNFQYSLPEASYNEIKKYIDDYSTASKNLIYELKHQQPPASYANYIAKSNALYEHIYTLNKTLQVKGINTFNKGTKIYSSVIALQSTITFIGLLLSLIFGIWLAYSIIRPLKQLQKSTETLAGGDLRSQAPTTSKDEIGMVAKAFNHAVAQLRSMVSDASNSARLITSSSTNLFQVTEETQRSSKDLAKVMETLAQDASEQSTAIQHSVTTVQKALAETKTVTEKTLTINDSCKICSSTAQKGQLATEDIRKVISSMIERIQESHSLVCNLAVDLNQIQDFVKTISEITETTKLLSVNASIEAARSGEHGRGFGVVASSIRQLALQAQESAEHINNVVSTIFIKTDNVVATVEKGAVEAEEGSQTLNHNVQIYQDLIDQVNLITDEIQQVTTIISAMSQENKSVMSEMDKISRISENNMAAVEEVSAMFEEQYASTVVVTEAAQNLQKMAGKLTMASNSFKL